MTRPWRSAADDAAREPRPPRLLASLLTTSMRFGASSATVDLWYVDLDVTGEVLEGLRSWLSGDELARSQRLRSALARTRYIAGRAALRGVLAGRLGCSPTAVRFTYGKHGKPRLAGGPGDIDFNLAHSEGEAVVGLASGAAIGVDIEVPRPVHDIESLARLVFSDVERRELELASDPLRAFLNGWTRKEAYLKGLGLGLTVPLGEITVSLSATASLLASGLRNQAASSWRLLNATHPRAVVALAIGPADTVSGSGH